jgi:uncharacterized protein YdeI (YjbR/CyaY-like superfamily)
MSARERAPLVRADDRATWRTWLEANHAVTPGAWLLIRRRADAVGLEYQAAVEEALCFGWVDSTLGQVEGGVRKLYFAPRRPRSPWAASNRARVEGLIAGGRMSPAGLAVVARAKADGSWNVLAQAERLEVPEDLATALRMRAPADMHFDAFPASTRRMLLGWIATARRPETRAARITRVAEAAAQNERTPVRVAGRAPAPADGGRSGEGSSLPRQT